MLLGSGLIKLYGPIVTNLISNWASFYNQEKIIVIFIYQTSLLITGRLSGEFNHQFVHPLIKAHNTAFINLTVWSLSRIAALKQSQGFLLLVRGGGATRHIGPKLKTPLAPLTKPYLENGSVKFNGISVKSLFVLFEKKKRKNTSWWWSTMCCSSL